MYGLSAKQMEEEPLDQFLVNNFIEYELVKQEQRQAKYARK